MAKTKSTAKTKATAKRKPARKSVALRATGKRPAKRAAAKKADPQYISWRSIEPEALNPLLQRQLVVGQEIMVARIVLKKGCIVPEHSHHNEQLSCILEGSLRFWIGGRVLDVNAGEVLAIPSNLPHKAEALVDTLALDVFTPPRADWINKTDQYLRR